MISNEFVTVLIALLDRSYAVVLRLFDYWFCGVKSQCLFSYFMVL